MTGTGRLSGNIADLLLRSENKNIMNQEIKPGTMFLQSGTDIPESVSVDHSHSTKGWASIESSISRQFRQDLHSAGWTFFNMGVEIEVTVVGFNKQKLEDRAAQKLIDIVKSQDYNCVQVTQIRNKGWLGTTTLTLNAQARQVQKDAPGWPVNGWTTILQRCLQNA